MYRIVVVDDRPLPRAAARTMLAGLSDMALVGEAGSGIEALSLMDRMKPDLVLMDVDMPGMDGAEVTRQLLDRGTQVKILAWTVSDSSDDLLRMIDAGCSGYVLKDVGPDELHRAIRAAIRNEAPVPRKMLPEVLKRAAKDTVRPVRLPQVSLTKREHECLRFLARGRSVKQIATEMGIKPSSVDTHQRHIYRKLEVNSRGEAISVGFRLGLLRVGDL